jgi:Rps23 Pro-64 3,4-dihydroxylase Tpa1-like proline 4-hydroxylase
MSKKTEVFKPTRIQIIEGKRSAFIFDDYLDLKDYKTISKLSLQGEREEQGSEKKKNTDLVETRHMGIRMSPKDFQASHFYKKISAQIEATFGCDVQFAKRIYMTFSRYGENSLLHTDGWPGKRKDQKGVTAVIFMNHVWKPEWAGELVFFDKKSDAVTCVLPKPFRMVLSHSDVIHRSGIPSRLCFDLRCSLVIMFLVKEKSVGKKVA